MLVVIKNRYNDQVIVFGEYTSLKDCLEKNRDADLFCANFKGADLVRAYLSGMNFERANFSGANLVRANFTDANLVRANFTDAYLEGAYFERANLWGAYFEGAHLEGAHLEGAYFKGAHLVRAYFEGAHLDDANFSDANLEYANFSGANLMGAKGIILPIVSISGSMHNFYYHNGIIRIGCKNHSVEHWLENYRSIGEKNYYSESQIAEYAAYINFFAQFVEAEALKKGA